MAGLNLPFHRGSHRGRPIEIVPTWNELESLSLSLSPNTEELGRGVVSSALFAGGKMKVLKVPRFRVTLKLYLHSPRKISFAI